MAVRQLDIKNDILSRAKALGNSDTGLKEVCSDLVNSYGVDSKSLQRLATGTFLSTATLKRMSKLTETEDGAPYRPNADTCERIFKFFGAQISFNTVKISPRYQNQPKPGSEHE